MTPLVDALRRLPLPRRLRRTWAPGLAVRAAWTWEAEDRADPRWWPQGVAAPGHGLLLVAWYAKDGGARVSVADTRAGRYAHVPLAGEDGGPLHVHAGGLATDGPWLHVAATRAGFVSLHADDLPSAPAEPWQVRRASGPLEVADGPALRVSFLAPAAGGLVVGEYARGEAPRRLAHVPLDDGVPTGPARVLGDGPAGMQGAVLAVGAAELGAGVLSTSHGPWVPGTLWTGAPGAWRARRWALPMGPEDLARDPDGRLWCATEHPHRRWLVRVAG
ncbi:hypothetical protein [Nocardioides bruguierae]|uniref:hypothetical protein n=1 Tax=Nocardioides bruguierae TaxID=2945102 RepID=UPI002020D7DF|nr:hypothetical protein [Nocardioides bruguierae]MCL8025721.1 hypothetical protein [Nocardioides bruguierae]